MSTPAESDLQKQFVALAPNLRAFARSLTKDSHEADDLVQETLVKAWANRNRFAEGSNLKAWLFTILRNCHVSNRRKLKREVQDEDGLYAEQMGVRPAQVGHMDLLDFAKAFATLPSDQREALILVGAEGFSYEEAALMCGCAIGTIKSRVNRARTRLTELMGVQGSEDFGTDFEPNALASRATPQSSLR